MLFSQQLEGHLDRNGDALNDITGDMDLTSVEHAEQTFFSSAYASVSSKCGKGEVTPCILSENNRTRENLEYTQTEGVLEEIKNLRILRTE